MNPQLLMVGLETPLENLLELPQAVQIAYAVREELIEYSPRQLQALLGGINGMIEIAVNERRATDGDESTERQDQRDLDWLLDAILDEHLLVPAGLVEIDDKDYYRVLALYKLGSALTELSRDGEQIILTAPSVAALMEAQAAWLMSELLPARLPLSEEIAETWHDGLSPDPDITDEVKEALSKVAQHAADRRHQANRQAKKQALEIYFAHQYRTIELAAEIIGKQVCRAPRTVRNWIFEARRERGLTAD